MEMLILNHRHKQLEHVCENYTKNEDNVYVYGSCVDMSSKKDKSRKWLVVFKKLDNTVTNEKRLNVVNESYAKFRANRLEVVEIINMKNPKQRKNRIMHLTEYCCDSIPSKSLIYEVGKIVECNNFNHDINVVHGPGIYYFKSLITAYCCEMVPNPIKDTDSKDSDSRENNDDDNDSDNNSKERIKYLGYAGKWIGWYDNGVQSFEGEYINGLRENKWIYWYDNGRKKCLEYYKNDLRNGKCFRWDEHGFKTAKEFYVNGKREGRWIHWYDECRQMYICHYKNDILNGRWIELYDYDKVSSGGSYKDGKPDSIWNEYGPDGNKISEAHYDKGIRESIILWNNDGSISYDSLSSDYA